MTLAILGPILLKAAFPAASFGITEGVKWVWEKYLIHWPTSVSIGFAGAIGAGLSALVGAPGIDPTVGLLMGLGAAAVHDVVSPPSSQGSGGTQIGGGSNMVTRVLVVAMLVVAVLAGCVGVQKQVDTAITSFKKQACVDPTLTKALLNRPSIPPGSIDVDKLCGK
jgi:hypothetical protein